ncbi:uncharacterized protein LOC142224991 [Haematobia irritans]|uniref:uncharacterized protein LOC142224991 n=1 Tax=Haematobia irritans TaxID=7368 RepID=UPI003F4F44CA
MGMMEDFLVQCEEITNYVEQLKLENASDYNELSLEAEEQEIQKMWSEWKDCGWKNMLKVDSGTHNTKSNSSMTVPPCDTQIFHGDYVNWPSFRDLFTAIYINNRKLSSVEKLYHLFQKTSGEAREINRNVPLTSEGFDIAWGNLKNQYENKRILINNQLRILFNLPHCSHETSAGLKKLQREITNCVSVLKLFKIDIGSWDPIFVYQCSSRLPKLTLSLWEQSIAKDGEIPKWDDLNNFLTERFHALEGVSEILGANDAGSRQKYNNFEKSKQYKVHHTKVKSQKCTLCKGNHNLKSCPKFMNADFKCRLTAVKKSNACLNCLSQGHRAVECTSKSSCNKCNLKHHTLMHKENLGYRSDNMATTNEIATRDEQISQNTEFPTTSNNVRAYHANASNRTLLATAWVSIVHHGQTQRVRALIDPCSDDSFISVRIQKMMRLPTRPISADISGLGGGNLTRCSKIAFFKLCSQNIPPFALETDALVVQDVTGNVPTQSFQNISLDKLPNIHLADPLFYKSAPVDILIGGNLYPLILLKGVKHGILGTLVAQETVFGWIVTGPTNERKSDRVIRVSHCTKVCVNKLLTKFWEIENVPQNLNVSEEDKLCEEIYKNTTIRMENGRYRVDLPFKSVPPHGAPLSSNRYVAMSQFLRNERSLARKPELKTMYDEVIKEYLSLGHMKEVMAPKDSSDEYFYLPHHGVFKPESTTTKLRVVFNASCPSRNGKSLNDFLFVGPVLQNDILTLILNWRLYKFVFNADITQMYRQILVNPNHTPYQRILFRTSQDEEVRDFELQTVTFGVNCAPYLAIRTLLKLAEDEEHNFPMGAKILRQNMYVDDALVGSHSVSDGLEARNQLIGILLSAGFHLRKWVSNTPQLLEGLSRDHMLNREFLDFSDKSVAKTLGIRWNGVSDSFYFVAEQIQNKPLFTKREVLSIIARLFDPLGWLAPVVVTAKIIMQQLWLDNIQWDDQLRPLTLLRWKNFVLTYKDIGLIQIPRWIRYNPQCRVEVHGFCDSSESAYAAAVYASVTVEGKTSIYLLVAKSRVAPIKKLSLPRLELCGALLLSEVLQAVLPQFKVPNNSVYLWSDSTIVLAWLKKPSHNWATFVANRVAKIQERVEGQWRHVSTHDNPADLATRGLSPLELKENDLWWQGPHWLKKEKSFWPTHVHVPETSLEMKQVKSFVARSAENEDILDRFSCLSKAIHVVGYILRFFAVARAASKSKNTFTSLRLSSGELTAARIRLMVLSQKMYFPHDYICLREKRPLEAKSSLLTLTPFLDKDSLIRANGRLGSTMSLTYNERHPIIISHHSRLARLYVDFIHKLTLHGGMRLMVATIRLECWVIKVKNLVRTHIHNCKQCVLAKRNMQKQVMAALPPERTTISRPFCNTGVDFAGPYDIKAFSGRCNRITKGYICLFVCFATRANHLEAVSDMSTQAFLAALTRFVARRGCPNRMYSDNGRNFVGAAKEIRNNFVKILSLVKSEAISRYGFQKLEWHFIPAAAPHMGGLWEAGVKSCKTHLKKIAGQIKCTFEEFSTILSSIEYCLNSRPLTPMSQDVDDIGCLTPGHFLVGAPLLAPAEPEVCPSNMNLSNRWQRLKAIRYDFSRRWKSDYLKELHKRNKWKQPEENIRENDLVVLRQETMGQNEWRLGRVTRTYVGADGHVRVVDLKTQMAMEFDEEYRCPLCTTRHGFRYCRKFLTLHPLEKTRLVERYEACVNCLGLSHRHRDCRSRHRCFHCRVRHHTLLHPPDEAQWEWLQMTAMVRARQFYREEEKPMLMRVLLDPNRMTSQVIIPDGRFPLKIPDQQGYVKLQLADRATQVRTLTATMEIYRGPAPYTPRRHCDPSPIHDRYDFDELSDPCFPGAERALIILGDDVAHKVYLGLPQWHEGDFFGQNTIFGWTVFGKIPIKPQKQALDG